MSDALKKYWPFLLIFLAIGLLGFKFFFGHAAYPFQKMASSSIGMSAPAMMGSEMAYDMPAPAERSMGMGGAAMGMSGKMMAPIAPAPDFAPVKSDSRMVVSESSISMVVNNVKDQTESILTAAKNMGGYMVSSTISDPGERGTATIIIRVPSANLDQMLVAIRAAGIRVVSENLTGHDVTDQYTDLTTRIDQYEQTKLKLQELLDKSKEVSDLVSITQQIQSMQMQIDTLKGQQQYLSQNAELAKITIYLSTDEFALPYQPEQPFRPDTVFKTAVRSLLTFFSEIAAKLIWLAVYSIVWLPLLLIAIFLWKRMKK